MTDCVSTPATGVSLDMWKALDPRQGSPMTGESGLAIARRVAMDAGLSAEEVSSPTIEQPPLDNIATDGSPTPDEVE